MRAQSKSGKRQKSSERSRSKHGPPLQVSGEYFKLVPHGAALVVVKVVPEKLQDSSGDVLTR